MKIKNVMGRRVIKTGIAVFLTAWFCRLLDIPAMFAVITAIVTIEPTAADSLKKGIIRLPAAAIGAALALLFDLAIGPSSLAYALVAMITIVACHHLKLDNGTLVATLTAIAMIPGTSESFVIDFITRLSSTSIGIIVSSLVNFLVLPPKFGPIIYYNVDRLYDKTASILEENMCNIEKEPSNNELSSYRELSQEIDRTFQLTNFQEDEWKYRSYNNNEKRSFLFIQRKLDFLQKVVFHLGNLCYLNVPSGTFTKNEKDLLEQSIQSISAILQDPLHNIPTSHFTLMEKLSTYFSPKASLKTLSLQLHPHSIVLYELLFIHQILIELKEVTVSEQKYSFNNREYPKYIFTKNVQYD